MSSELYALFRAVAAEPESTVPKLVAADYLEEHGDDEWAKFIRSECKAGPTVEIDENESRTAIVRERFKAFRKLVANVEYIHGFPRRVTMNVDQFTKNFDAANALWPLVHVKLIKAKGRAAELAKCKHLARVPSLDFDFNKLNQAELATLLASPHIRNVEELVLNNNPLGKAGTETLAAANLPKLRRLSATSAGLTTAGVVSLLTSRTLGKITHWNLSNNPFTGTVTGQHTVPSHFADVEELNLGAGVRDEIAALLATVDRPIKLRKLNLVGGSLGAGFVAFASSPHFSSVEELFIGQIQERGVPGLTKLCQSTAFKNLHTLRINSVSTGDAGFRAFVGDGLPSLRTLSITDFLPNITGQDERDAAESIGKTDFREFVRSPLLQRIEHLDLSDNGLGEVGAKLLSQHANSPRLTTVNLEDTGLNAAAIQHFVRSRWCPNMTTLNLSGNLMSTTAWSQLAKARHWKHLRSLELRYCELKGGPEFKKFLESPLFAGLEVLDMSSNPLGDAAIIALAASPTVGNLRILELDTTKLTDKAAAAIAKSPHFRSLESLNLRWNDITETGIRHFLKAPHLPRLRTVTFGPTNSNSALHAELTKRYSNVSF